MSNASLPSDSSTLEESRTRGRVSATVRTIPALVVGTCRTVGFWTAVGLPFLYVPLLTVGLDSTQDLLLFLVLLLVNVAALFAGRNHTPK